MAGLDEGARAGRARDLGVFRYSVIAPALDKGLTAKQRGVVVRHLAARTHTGPDGTGLTVTRWTIDRWVRLYRQGGFEALMPGERNIAPRTPTHQLELALALKRENPGRTAAQVAAIVKAHLGDGPAERTLQTHFRRAGLHQPFREDSERAFGRFEAAQANDRWTGDVMHGITVGGAKTLLFAWLDDHTRLLAGYRWVRREDTIRAEITLRAAFASRGLPRQTYLDNGAPFVDGQLRGTLARLGIQLVHSAPGRPQGRGKIERFFRTVRDQFLVELQDDQIQDMDTLNRLFTAWVEQVYHQRVHTETQAAPLARWEASWNRVTAAGGAGPRYASEAELRAAFLWAEYRKVTKTATISLHSNTYEVDPFLVGRTIEVRFDPFDLTHLDVYLAGKRVGVATPHVIREHTHRKARPDEATPIPAPTGISYLAHLTATHEKHLAQGITFAPGVPANGAPVAGQIGVIPVTGNNDDSDGLLLAQVVAQ